MTESDAVAAQAVPQKPRKKGLRKFSWVILVINALFLVWLIAGIASASKPATGCGTLSQSTCQAANDVGAGIGAILIVFLWVAADIILGIIWLITRPRQR